MDSVENEDSPRAEYGADREGSLITDKTSANGVYLPEDEGNDIKYYALQRQA